MIRITTAVHRVVPGNPPKSGGYALKAIQSAAELGSDIILLPALSLSGASSADLLRNSAVLACCRDVLDEIAEMTADTNAYIIAGLPMNAAKGLGQISAVLHSGEILEMFPSDNLFGNLTGYSYCSPSIGIIPGAPFDCGGLNVAVLPCNPAKLPIYAVDSIRNGADLILVPSASPVTAGFMENCRRTALEFTKATGCALAVCNGNLGESSSPDLYKPFAGIFECGEQLAWQVGEDKHFMVTADIDIDIIRALSNDRSQTCDSNRNGRHILNDKNHILREVRQNPFLPTDFKETIAFTAELFEMQTEALAARLRNTGMKKAALGCSGGVDSTLSLLVAAAAMDRLSLPRENIIGITMPGFGTSSHTYCNAMALMNELRITRREIPIRAAVTQHFLDIGHDQNNRNTTYENAQARERTQILMDIANSENALVIGSGDMSELALGWCTFGGDHLAGYNVNASVTKTLARSILRYLAESGSFADISATLHSVLDAPVSPELLPTNGNGEIEQKTEDILGPYILHEFFLYYFVRYNMTPSKIYEYALHSFEGDYSNEEILKTLVTFIKRFFGAQFKRSCSPDSAALLDISLSPFKYRIPSDASAAFLLSELESHVSLS